MVVEYQVSHGREKAAERAELAAHLQTAIGLPVWISSLGLGVFMTGLAAVGILNNINIQPALDVIAPTLIGDLVAVSLSTWMLRRSGDNHRRAKVLRNPSFKAFDNPENWFRSPRYQGVHMLLTGRRP